MTVDRERRDVWRNVAWNWLVRKLHNFLILNSRIDILELIIKVNIVEGRENARSKWWYFGFFKMTQTFFRYLTISKIYILDIHPKDKLFIILLFMFYFWNSNKLLFLKFDAIESMCKKITIKRNNWQ